jgi:hypothetical protein
LKIFGTKRGLRATPTVLQIAFAFLFLQKSLQNSYPTVWQMGFAFLLTWQNPRMDWHICKLTIGLAFRLTHYSRASGFPFFEFWQVNFAKPLEITFFSHPHIDLRVGKLHLLPNKKCKTVGVALRASPADC